MPRQPSWSGVGGILTACRRFKTMEAASLRLQKESKGYLDSLRGENSPRIAALE